MVRGGSDSTDSARFESARLIAQAIDAIVQPLKEALHETATTTNVDPAVLILKLESAFKGAVASGMKAGIALLEQAVRVDAGATLDVGDFANRIVTGRLLSYAREVADGGSSKLPVSILEAVPGRSPDWPRQAGQALPAAAVVHSVLEAIDDGRNADAIKKISEQLVSGNSRNLLMLRLAAMAYQGGREPNDAASIVDLATKIAGMTDDSEVATEQSGVLINMGRLKLAETALKRALRLDFMNDQAKSMLGKLTLSRTGRGTL